MAADDEVAPDLEERLADNAAIHPDPSIIRDAARDYEELAIRASRGRHG